MRVGLNAKPNCASFSRCRGCCTLSTQLHHQNQLRNAQVPVLWNRGAFGLSMDPRRPRKTFARTRHAVLCHKPLLMTATLRPRCMARQGVRNSSESMPVCRTDAPQLCVIQACQPRLASLASLVQMPAAPLYSFCSSHSPMLGPEHKSRVDSEPPQLQQSTQQQAHPFC